MSHAYTEEEWEEVLQILGEELKEFWEEDDEKHEQEKAREAYDRAMRGVI